MWTLIYLIFFYRPCKLSSVFKILFSFCWSIWVCSIALSSSSLILSSATSSLNTSSVFSVQLLYYSGLWLLFGTLLYFLCLLQFSLPSFILFLKQVSIFKTTTLNSLSDKLLTCFIKGFLSWGFILLFCMFSHFSELCVVPMY